MAAKEFEAFFYGWRDALNRGDLDGVYAVMDEDIVIFDEDIPWRFNKAISSITSPSTSPFGSLLRGSRANSDSSLAARSASYRVTRPSVASRRTADFGSASWGSPRPGTRARASGP